jgi:hypothetical protein
LPFRQIGCPSAEHREPLRQSIVQLRQAEHAQSSRGQLDGERQAVQPSADRRQQRTRLGVHLQIEAHRPSPLDE